jgi:hypothetical protein
MSILLVDLIGHLRAGNGGLPAHRIDGSRDDLLGSLDLDRAAGKDIELVGPLNVVVAGGICRQRAPLAWSPIW